MDAVQQNARQNILVQSYQAETPQLTAQTVAVNELSESDHQYMYVVFERYYENHPYQQFKNDLSEKNHVILLKDKDTKRIQGFSTLLKQNVITPIGSITGIYSGDTVINKGYWGSTALGKEFLKYLWKEKMKSPLQPLYWFLISKGFRTYLMMANNFTNHWPRHEEETPRDIKAIMNKFYSQKFPDGYLPEKDLIVPKGQTCRLKDDVSDIDDHLRKNKRIHFFETKNPHWKQGVELTCIAEMSLTMPIKYSLKKALQLRKPQ